MAAPGSTGADGWLGLVRSGIDHAQGGRGDEARTAFLNALKASRRSGDAGEMLEALVYSGRALYEIGEPELARGALTSARRIADRVGDQQALETCRRTLDELSRSDVEGADGPAPATPVRNTRGESLPMTIGMYDLRRPAAAKQIGTLCHAPFVSVDFGPQGQVTVCNHYHDAMARLSDGDSFLDVWRGEAFRKLRRDMSDYVIDENRCRHCARQIRAGDPRQTFAVQQYDPHPATELDPDYPSLLTFRLSNRCNLACIMCDGDLSSRIRRERDRLPPHVSPYGERFFEEMREVLPRVRHIEFFGGEPLLVPEHQRIFEILEETGAGCSIYINTNGTAMNRKTKGYLERLNFRTIAVSMDSTIPEVHGRIRVGVQHDVFLRNLDWLLELRERRPIHLLLNVTEQRANWFDLPELFRFAARIGCAIHINTCIHPAYCSLYTLPTEQLELVRRYLEAQRDSLAEALTVCQNQNEYDHLLRLVTSELDARTPEWRPPDDWLPADPVRAATDGRLPAPIPGHPPFDTPESTARWTRWFRDQSPSFAEEPLADSTDPNPATGERP